MDACFAKILSQSEPETPGSRGLQLNTGTQAEQFQDLLYQKINFLPEAGERQKQERRIKKKTRVQTWRQKTQRAQGRNRKHADFITLGGAGHPGPGRTKKSKDETRGEPSDGETDGSKQKLESNDVSPFCF